MKDIDLISGIAAAKSLYPAVQVAWCSANCTVEECKFLFPQKYVRKIYSELVFLTVSVSFSSTNCISRWCRLKDN